MGRKRGTWLRVPALVLSAIGLIALTLAFAGSDAGADPGNGNGNGNGGNSCVSKGDDTDAPPEGCDTSRPSGKSQGKVCPENHPKGKRVPAVDKGLSPDRPHGKAVGGTEVVCATTQEVPTTTTTVASTTPTTPSTSASVGGTTEVKGVTVQAPASQGVQAAPTELAFTGPALSPGVMTASGISLIGLGALLFLLESRVPAMRRVRR